jgi:hypothetical protein
MGQLTHVYGRADLDPQFEMLVSCIAADPLMQKKLAESGNVLDDEVVEDGIRDILSDSSLELQRELLRQMAEAN